MGQFILKRDDIKLGFTIGLLMPLIGILVFYLWKFSSVTFSEFWRYLGDNKNLITSLSVICLFLNVVVFTLYINTKRDKTAKGIFVITVVFGIASLVFKFWG
jgi:dolichol kinase